MSAAIEQTRKAFLSLIQKFIYNKGDESGFLGQFGDEEFR